MSTQEAFSLAADINMKQNYLKTDYVVCLFFFPKNSYLIESFVLQRHQEDALCFSP